MNKVKKWESYCSFKNIYRWGNNVYNHREFTSLVLSLQIPNFDDLLICGSENTPRKTYTNKCMDNGYRIRGYIDKGKNLSSI